MQISAGTGKLTKSWEVNLKYTRVFDPNVHLKLNY